VPAAVQVMRTESMALAPVLSVLEPPTNTQPDGNVPVRDPVP